VIGTHVHLRDVVTLDDLADVTAPAPVEPGDPVATPDDLYRVEVVLWTPPTSRRIPALARRVVLNRDGPCAAR
jgi:hypothetical protein